MRSGAWTVDHALRALATGCAVLPAVGAVVLGPESVRLRLTTPGETPPPGWTASDQGRTWEASLHQLANAPVDDRIPEPYPLLVSAGVVDGGRLLLNLAEAGGLVGVEGDLELARGLVRSWSRRLTTSPWSARVRAIRVGFPPDSDFNGWDVARLVEAAAELDDPYGGVLLFAEQPHGRDAYQVERLLAEPARRWTVVVVGAVEATWRLTVGVDGTLDTGMLAEPARAA
ncbi:hypothetical protein BJ973_006647 [Actinoplanes tereljensis]|uniref:Uncharacterized protein n=1 Tax=Paractinoplanes tereljensis TaxID=571912 RepID=A0A919NL18_9ACTN|nr:hypothetical protein [Actinoplanes tereljensis]GIF19602.1 hypothetical protein Ate02nite_23320 [Actinoplanes tereljensis]